jgi:hypothetical protein
VNQRNHREDADTLDSRAAGDAPTSAERPLARERTAADGRGGPSSGTGTSGTGSLLVPAAARASPEQTLWTQEIARMRVLLLSIVLIGVFMAGWVELLIVDPTARAVAWIAIAITVLPSAVMRVAMREPAAYTEARITALAIACVVGTTGVVYAFGVYSPAVVTTMFGVGFYAPSQSRSGTLLVCVTAAALYAALAAGVGAGVVPDVGLVGSAGLGWPEQLTIVVAVEAFYVVSYVLGRASRAVTLRARSSTKRCARAGSAATRIKTSARSASGASSAAEAWGTCTRRRIARRRCPPPSSSCTHARSATRRSSADSSGRRRSSPRSTSRTW